MKTYNKFCVDLKGLVNKYFLNDCKMPGLFDFTSNSWIKIDQNNIILI